jgi:excisionase family DNA binding protein
MQNEVIYKKLLEIEKLLKLGTDEVFDIEAAAKFLKTTKSTIYQYVFNRKIPFYKPNKRLYFSKLSLMEWLQEHKVKTVEELEKEMKPNYNNRYKWLRSNK